MLLHLLVGAIGLRAASPYDEAEAGTLEGIVNGHSTVALLVALVLWLLYVRPPPFEPAAVCPPPPPCEPLRLARAASLSSSRLKPRPCPHVRPTYGCSRPDRGGADASHRGHLHT
eukprot:6596383-Prymnesium_polylepis.2